MAHRFFFVRGALGQRTLLAEHHQAIDRILSGDYTEKNIEYLQGFKDVYSFRDSLAARLLFTTITKEGESYLLILDYLANHEYEKSKFLNSPLSLEHYKESARTSLMVENQPPLTSEASSQAHHKTLLWTPLDKEQEAHLKATLGSHKMGAVAQPIDYYQSEWVFLNSEQEQVFRLKLPGLLSGVAGSGKSLVALSLLSEAQNRFPHAAMLYVTRSAMLIRSRQLDWSKLPISRDSDVSFKTYEQLIHDITPSAYEKFDEKNFSDWYKKYVKLKLTISERGQYVPLEADVAYEEFRIASGYSLSEYESLGEALSLVARSRRHELYHALIGYKKYLEKNNAIDPSFYDFSPDTKRYALIVVDEAQDMSYGQLVELSKLAQDQQILFCFDGHQRLFDRRSILSFVKSKFYLKDENFIALSESFRCTSAISLFVNAFLSFKHTLLKTKVNKHDATEMIAKVEAQAFSGAVHLVTPDELTKKCWSTSLGDSSKILAVTLPQYKQEVVRLFNIAEAHVFTPSEIKGLESDEILVWKLCDENMFYQIANGRIDTEACVKALNALYTTYTRARARLILCEEGRHTNAALHRIYAHYTPLPETREDIVPSEQDWLKHAYFLWSCGYKERAQAIYEKKGGARSSFEHYIASQFEVSVPQLNPVASTAMVAARPAKVLLETAIEQVSPDTTNLLHYAQALSENFEYEYFIKAVSACDIGELLATKVYKKGRGSLSLLELIKRDARLTDHFFAWVVDDDQFIRSKSLKAALKGSGNFLAYKNYSIKKKIFEEIYEKYNQDKIPLKDWILIAELLGQLGILIALEEHPKFLGAFFEYIDNNKSIRYITSLFETEQISPKRIEESLDQALGHALSARRFSFINKLYALNFNVNEALYRALYAYYLERQLEEDYLALLQGLRGAGINLSNIMINGRGLVHQVVAFNLVGVLYQLDEWHLDLNQTIDGGYTPAFLAAKYGYLNVLNVLNSLHVNLSKQLDNYGHNLAHMAIKYKHDGMLRFLTYNQVDLCHFDINGLAPSGLAVGMGDLKSLRCLYELIGLRIDSVPQTPLQYSLAHIATLNNRTEILHQLKAWGLALNDCNSKGIRPIDIAYHHQNSSMIALFNTFGINIEEGAKLPPISNLKMFGLFSGMDEGVSAPALESDELLQPMPNP